MNYLPLVLLALAVVVLLTLSRRAKLRQAQSESLRQERIVVGTEVMTTSGLYGTVTARNDDGTVVLSIAPGVEVRWEFAALRDAASLPDSVAGRANLARRSTAGPPDGGVDLDKPTGSADRLPGRDERG